MSSIDCSTSGRSGHINYVAFNQEGTCITVATSAGIRIYSIDAHQICYKYDVGSVR